jgi:hypothetical protein
MNTLRALARGLQARGVVTPRGKLNWTATGVRNLLHRVEV